MGPAQYLISLCNNAQISDESFGITIRIGSSNSKFKFEAAKVIQSIVTFSPAPDAIAVEFLNELGKVEGISSLVKPVLDHTSQFDCTSWAIQVIEFLHDNFSTSQRSVALKPFTDLVTDMLSHLLIARKKTPQQSSPPSPDVNRLRETCDLLEEATAQKSLLALKELLFRRDGSSCPFTGFSLRPPGRFVRSECAHILPFSFQSKPLTLKALEAFTGRRLTNEVIHPEALWWLTGQCIGVLIHKVLKGRQWLEEEM